MSSLAKQDVIGPATQTLDNVKPVEYKWLFIRKRKEKNKIMRYKVRLVAQGFSQRLVIDYDETYLLGPLEYVKRGVNSYFQIKKVKDEKRVFLV